METKNFNKGNFYKDVGSIDVYKYTLIEVTWLFYNRNEF